MKKTLVIIMVMALVMGFTAEPTAAMAATTATPKVFAFDFAASDVLAICYHMPHVGYIPPYRMVMVTFNNGMDSANLYGGTLQFDSTVKFKKQQAMFKSNEVVPNGTIAALINNGKMYERVFPTNIRTWDDFRKHVIGLPEEVANSPEPPAEWPLANRTNIVEAENPYDVGQAMLAELQQALPDIEIAVVKEIANDFGRYNVSLKAGKVMFGIIVYGSAKEGFNTFFVQEIGKRKGFWSGYIGNVAETAEYIVQKTPTKK